MSKIIRLRVASALIAEDMIPGSCILKEVPPYEWETETSEKESEDSEEADESKQDILALQLPEGMSGDEFQRIVYDYIKICQCQRNELPEKGLTPNEYDHWCDECFYTKPLSERFKTAKPEDIEQLIAREKQAKEERRKRREEKAALSAKGKKKKVKLTGFENVEDETPEEIERKKADLEIDGDPIAELEEQPENLEWIFHYEPKD